MTISWLFKISIMARWFKRRPEARSEPQPSPSTTFCELASRDSTTKDLGLPHQPSYLHDLRGASRKVPRPLAGHRRNRGCSKGFVGARIYVVVCSRIHSRRKYMHHPMRVRWGGESTSLGFYVIGSLGGIEACPKQGGRSMWSPNRSRTDHHTKPRARASRARVARIFAVRASVFPDLHPCPRVRASRAPYEYCAITSHRFSITA